MCFCLWFMQYNSMKRNMAQLRSTNKQTEMMQKTDAVDVPDHVHLLRCRHAVRRAGLLADQQRVQPAAVHIVAGVRIPDPWLSGCGGAKEKRDHRT